MTDQQQTPEQITPETKTITPGKSDVLDLLSSAGTSEIPKDDIFKASETATTGPISGTTGISSAPVTPGNTPGNAFGNGPGQPTNNTNAPAPDLSAGVLVSGATATDFMDVAIPGLLVWLVSMLGYELDKKGLQLSADEKKTIAPFMQQALNAAKFNFNNPFVNLAVVLGTIYGMKVITMLPDAKKKSAKVVPIKPVEAVTQVQNHLNKQQERALKLKQEVTMLKGLGRMGGIVWLQQNKKMSKVNASKWYDKNVK